tara:strand:- start:135 stop:527 length:393 start_codon:yes stop_codon:yes gene_type:complete
MKYENETLRERRDALPAHQFFIIHTELAEPTDDVRAALEPLVTQHLDWVRDLEESGILFAAGPLVSADEPHSGAGMIVVRGTSKAEAEALAATCPFHKAGVRKFTVRGWQINEGSLNVTLRISNKSMLLG